MKGIQEIQLHREEKSRTEYSARNTTVAMCARVIAILLGFCTRVVFTHTLSEAYVGINGLFTDILNVLALSELGISTAITYALYQPVSEMDTEKQKSLMLLYKRFYRLVALIVLVAGLCVLPFMEVLIKNEEQVENLIFLYLMYLANSVISYLLVYKRTLIEAHQLSYIGVLYQTVFLIIQNVVQMVVLLTTKNFTLFLSVLILCTLLNNLCISKKADRMYPFLKEKQVNPLSDAEKQGIYQNVRAMLMHKVGNVVINNTDNLLLSSMVGIVSVGVYSNYYLVIGSVRQVLNQAFQGITASVGNLGVEESKEQVHRIFESAFFVGQWMFGFATICLFELLTPFVELSFGPKYVFSTSITFILCLNFYFTGMRQATLVFRDSLGVFWYDRYKSLAEAVINLVVSIILGLQFGVAGIFIGTLCSTLLTSFWVEPYMLYKHRLQKPVRTYFVKYGIYFVVMAAAWGLTYLLCSKVTGGTLIQCVVRLFICLIIPNLLFLLVYCRCKEFSFVFAKAKKMFVKWRGKENKKEHNAPEFSAEEEALFLLLQQCLLPECEKKTVVLSEAEWEHLVDVAQKHGVLSLLYEELCERQALPEHLRKLADSVASQVVLQQYRLLFTSKFVAELFQEKKLPVVLLKGVTVGNLYPVPELRKSGDVDILLLHPGDLERATFILEEAGCTVQEIQPALHHVCFTTPEGMELELHTMLAEPFDNEKTNVQLKKILIEAGECQRTESVMGIELPMLSGAYYPLELLLHMLQHFLRSGFGLKLLGDWVMYWQTEQSEEEKEVYLSLITGLGMKGFSDVVTLTCVRFLGLNEALISWMDCDSSCPAEEFMREILDAEEFGKSAAERMVVMRGTGLHDYIREFHHQMRLNYPKAGHCVLLWPVLWIATLVRFVANNRKLRKTSTKSILNEAARRSRMMRKLRLFH